MKLTFDIFARLLVAALAALVVSSACVRPRINAVGITQSTEIAWAVPTSGDIRAMLAERMRHNGVGIVVGVIDDNGRRVVTYGKSGAIDQRQLDGNTVFQIGSNTKSLTSLLLADMVIRGEVKLDDPAANYLPAGVTMPQRGRPITLLDLATHMSGLPSMPENYVLEAEPDPYEAYSVEQLHQFLSSYSLQREPGEKSAYSNLGVALLGRLLAHRAGMEYEALLLQRVLKPLGMNSTSIKLSENQRHRLASGHDRYLHPVRTWEMATLPASGSLRSTANDMLILLAAYLGYEETALKSAMAFQLSDHLPDKDRVQALGWGIRPSGVVSHSGGKQGYRSGVAFNPATGVGVVVLTNARTYDSPIEIARHLVIGAPLAPAPHAPAARVRVKLADDVLDKYIGRFQFSNGEFRDVARMHHHLLVYSPGNGISEFFATGPNKFFLATGNDEMIFQIGADGSVTGLILYGDGLAAGRGKLALRVRR